MTYKEVSLSSYGCLRTLLCAKYDQHIFIYVAMPLISDCFATLIRLLVSSQVVEILVFDIWVQFCTC